MLHALVRQTREKSARVPFRLPIDRVFSVDGFGTVVTGTLIDGHIAVGDEQGAAHGGHLNEAIISATAEIVITKLAGSVDRRKSEETGLNIWKF